MSFYLFMFIYLFSYYYLFIFLIQMSSSSEASFRVVNEKHHWFPFIIRQFLKRNCFSQSYQPWGAYAVGRVASSTLQCHSWWSRLASLHAGSLPIPSNSQQEASTSRSQELCGRPLGLFQVGLSLTETTQQAGSASRYCATCPYSRSWL